MKHSFDPISYKEILNSIFQRFPSVQTASFKDAYKPGLEGMEHFDQELGFPHHQFKTIHIAGTNGKGSVANMLAASLMGAGFKVGLYTSPHILDFRERIRINGTMIPKEDVYDFFMEWKGRFDELDLSFFEITTGLAFQWFAKEKVDYAVIETGLGGRLDSTNIITPLLSIITSIGLDHCGMLGDTLGKIAGEKAGIIKNGVPVIIGEVKEETRPVFVEKARNRKAPLYFAQESSPRFWNHSEEIYEKMDLKGEYQKQNLKTVLTALDLLSNQFPSFDWNEHADQMLHCLETTSSLMHFHGRWEYVLKNPCVICDIGHNAHALQHNFAQLKAMMETGKYTSLTMVYGIMADKDLGKILPLMPVEANYVFTQAATKRALDSHLLTRRFIDTHSKHGQIFDIPSVEEAVKKALELVQSEQETSSDDSGSENRIPLIYIGGSNFIVSEALPLFQQKE